MLTFAYIVSIICALVIAVKDIKKRIIPDLLLWPLLLCGIFIFGGDTDHVTAAILGYILGFILMMAAKNALGFGDVKLLMVAGLFLGVNGLSFATVVACVIGIIWGLIRKKKFVPFAPFLVIGTGVYYFVQVIKL